MSVHRCPDCLPRRLLPGESRKWYECKTCGGSHYVNRNSHGRITHPASAEDFLRQVRNS